MKEGALIKPSDFYDEVGNPRTKEIAKDIRLYSKLYNRDVIWFHSRKAVITIFS